VDVNAGLEGRSARRHFRFLRNAAPGAAV
jgi:hypothetical protein